jgi:hypothetical protein
MENAFKTPILFIIFNRPDTEQVVFDEIKKIRPKHLFVVADGPREGKAGEKERCEAAKKIIDQVDWDCEVHKNYSEVNMGCGKRVSSGITWFFDNVEEGIILEDDCVPDQSFFSYAESLLEKYRNDERVMMISGDNFQGGIKRGDGDYYFSRIPHIWGWASWRRAWKKYDFDVKDFPDFIKHKTIAKIFDKKDVQKYWLERIEEVYTHRLDTWDHQFFYSIWKNDGVCISPNKNLISNIGFGPEATHTHINSPTIAHIPIQSIRLPLVSPRGITVDKSADDFDGLAYMKNNTIKRFLKQIGLFDFMRYMYRKYV